MKHEDRKDATYGLIDILMQDCRKTSVLGEVLSNPEPLRLSPSESVSK